MTLTEENTAILIVDMQERFAPAIPRFSEISEKIKIFCHAAKILNIPLFVTEQYPKGLGHTVEDLKHEFPENTPIFEKIDFSCFGDEAFRKDLIQRQKKVLFVTGIESHICVLQTVLDAQERGFEVYLISDAVASRKDEDMLTAVEFLRSKGIPVLSTESVLFLLMKNAQHPAFREIQKIIK